MAPCECVSGFQFAQGPWFVIGARLSANYALDSGWQLQLFHGLKKAVNRK